MSGTKKQLLLARDEAGFFKKAADLFLESIAFAIKERKQCTIALSGGSTPKKLFQLLTQPYYQTRIDWPKVFIFWGDERCVPPTHGDSNYRMAQETLLSKVNIPKKNIYRIAGEMASPQEGAKAYEQALHAFFKLDYAIPHFDLILLGLGNDGHTASLFPKTEALNEDKKWITANYVEKFSTHRITMTVPIINDARRVLFLVQGEKKAEILHEVLRDDRPIDRYPAQLVRPNDGDLIWLFDKPAASKLPKPLLHAAFHL